MDEIQHNLASSGSAGRPRPDAAWWAGLAAWVLLAVGLGLRVAYAWASRILSEPDPSVVALMASHMASFRDFPTFFYGQTYMGSLEPAVGAVFVALMGPGGFAVSLGTVAVSLLALVLLARWGRDAAGPWGAVAALLLATVGPAVYFKFQVTPRGGYMVALAIDAAAIVLATDLAAALWEGRRASVKKAFLLGLVAGLGIWSNMIVASTLLAAALLVAVGMRGRVWRHLGVFGMAAAGGLVGALPLVLFALRHGRDAFGVTGLGAAATAASTLHNAWLRWLAFQTGEPHGSRVALAMAVLLLLLAGAGMVAAWGHRRDRSPRANFAVLGAALSAAIFVGVYLISGLTQLNAPRYFVPLVPPLALLSAVALAQLVPGRPSDAPAAQSHPGAVWLGRVALVGATVALLALQVAHLPPAFRHAAHQSDKKAGEFSAVADALLDASPDAFLADNRWYPLNFYLNEAVPVSDGRQEFYGPIRRNAELASHPAYHHSWRGIQSLLDRIGADYSLYHAGILAHVQAPPGLAGVDELACLDADVAPEPGVTSLVVRMDLPAEAKAPACLAVQPLLRTCVPMALHDLVDAIGVAAAVPAPEGQETLVPLREKIPVVPLQWSVCRAFSTDWPSPWIPLPDVPDEVTALVLTFQLHAPASPTPAWTLQKLWLFGQAEGGAVQEAEKPAEVLADLRDALDAHPGVALIAPRYYSAQLLAGGVDAERLPALSPRIFPPRGTIPPAAWEYVPPAEFPLDGRPFLLCVAKRYLPALRRELGAHGIPFGETAIAGGHVLLDAQAYEPQTSMLSFRIVPPCPLPVHSPASTP